MRGSYDVRIWNIKVYEGKRKTTYYVRWRVDKKGCNKPFSNITLADSFRSELITAAREGKPFDPTSGLPIDHRPKSGSHNWYDFAVKFVDAQWARLSANDRKNIAKTLTATTMALLEEEPDLADGQEVRTALREFAFNRNRRDETSPDVAAILRWVRRNSPTMASWEDEEKVDEVLTAIDTKLDGTPAAASTAKRHRRVLNVLMGHAVRRGVLKENPLPKGRGTSPKAATAVDKRCLLNPEQTAGLLAWVRQRPRGGERLHAYFATLYYAGLRPEEASR